MFTNRKTRDQDRFFQPGIDHLEDRCVPTVAGLQVINNSMWDGAEKVDIYVNNVRVANDLNFQQATPFVNVRAGRSVKVDVTAGTARNNARPLFTQTMNMTSGRTYVGMVAGEPTAPTSAGKFGMNVLEVARTKRQNRQSVDVLVIHGSPDAPKTDVMVEKGAVLANDTGFRQFGNQGKYTAVPARDLDIDVTLPNGLTEVREFDANFRSMGGSSLVLVETGMMDPEKGEDFGMLAVMPNGTTKLLPMNPPSFEGTEGDDVFVYTSPTDGVFQLFNSSNGTFQEYLAATNDTVNIEAKGGNDVMVIQGVEGRPLPGLNFQGGTGFNQIIMVGSEEADSFVVSDEAGGVLIESNVGRVFATGLSGLLIIGSGGNDLIDATGVSTLALGLYGGAGDDQILGGGGNDFISGDEGDDTVDGGSGDDQILGGDGSDQIDGNEGNDILEGGDADDKIIGGKGDDYLRGGFGLDLLMDIEGINELIDD